MTDPRIVFPGAVYAVTPTGLQNSDAKPTQCDIWVVRRLADFPHGRAPTGALVAPCFECGTPCAHADKPIDAPKVCMQCAGITPLPID